MPAAQPGVWSSRRAVCSSRPGRYPGGPPSTTRLGVPPMFIDAVELYHVAMPLISPWRTAYGEDAAVESVLVRFKGQMQPGVTLRAISIVSTVQPRPTQSAWIQLRMPSTRRLL